MLIHLTPKYFRRGPGAFDVDCQLIDYSIADIGLSLQAHKDLVIRTPFPNKHYLVACRKTGQKAIAGIFIDLNTQVAEFTATTRWLVDGEVEVTHRVHYMLADHDFDATTDNMLYWYGYQSSNEKWEARWPDCHKNAVPVKRMPRMDFLPQNPENPSRDGTFEDTLSAVGDMLIERNETFIIPSIDRIRLTSTRATKDRLPSIDHAFKL